MSMPPSLTITPLLLREHGITPDEFKKIEELLGRGPSLTELGIFSVVCGEFCS